MLWNTGCIGAWRSLVARTVRVGEVPGSNPGAPTQKTQQNAGFFVGTNTIAQVAREAIERELPAPADGHVGFFAVGDGSPPDAIEVRRFVDNAAGRVRARG